MTTENEQTSATTADTPADPRDAEITALKQQIADRDENKSGERDQAETSTTDGDAIVAEATRRHLAGEELSGQQLRALEHPEEFAGQQVPAPDSGTAPTA